MDRRKFLATSLGTSLYLAQAPGSLAQRPASGGWDPGRVRHLLPTVGDSRILIKASFTSPLSGVPTLRVGSLAVRGRMNDTAGEFWQFYAEGLTPARRYNLSLTAADGSALCQPWDLATFPSPEARPEHFRVLFYTCAGGPTARYLPVTQRSRLLRRALSFQPDAVVANGDHVYWDLHAPRAGGRTGMETDRWRAFDASAPVPGTKNEAVLKTVATPQIAPVYGTDFRSTPVFFLQDDHDHYENDEGTDAIVTFPPAWFQLQLARATQQLYYPEFLPDAARPAGLPWSSLSDRGNLSESFGTLRYGRLAEVLLYDVRRTMTMAGPSAVFVDNQVEKWLHERTASSEVRHLVHAPSNPPGWSAGKWGEWYPDVLGPDDRLTASIAKPYWQKGWLAQHDRLLDAISSMKQRTPLIVSGDLHALAIGKILRTGAKRLDANPVTAILAGPIGTDRGWPSAVRGVVPLPPTHLDVAEAVKPLEQHGFTIVDFEPNRIGIRMFKWNYRTEAPEAIDQMQPFHTTELVS